MRFIHFERKSDRLAEPGHFQRRVLRSALAALLIVFGALIPGMAGYMLFEGMGWVDAFANAAMILSGMGPLSPLQTDGGKIFAGLYAIFSGVLIIAISALVLAPVFHRVLHRFHVDDEKEGEAE